MRTTVKMLEALILSFLGILKRRQLSINMSDKIVNVKMHEYLKLIFIYTANFYIYDK